MTMTRNAAPTAATIADGPHHHGKDAPNGFAAAWRASRTARVAPMLFPEAGDAV